MSQKIKVQDGNIVYSHTDPTQPVNMTVLGVANITNEIVIGSVNSPTSGVITAGDGKPATILDPAEYTRLDIIAGNYGSLNISQSSSANSEITINNVKWPTSDNAIPGRFLGISDVNTLGYMSFVFPQQVDDSWTATMLNSTFPDAMQGQIAAGVTVFFYCIGNGQWRKVPAVAV